MMNGPDAPPNTNGKACFNRVPPTATSCPSLSDAAFGHIFSTCQQQRLFAMKPPSGPTAVPSQSMQPDIDMRVCVCVTVCVCVSQCVVVFQTLQAFISIRALHVQAANASHAGARAAAPAIMDNGYF